MILDDPTRFEAPLEFCALKEIYNPPSTIDHPRSGFIIHIQDAHANLSGQQNLAGALDQIISKYFTGAPLPILVEGGSRDDTLTPIKKIAPQKVWDQVAKRFLFEAKVSGEEYLNLASSHPMKIIGVEQKELYQKSIRAYADLTQQREAILDYLKEIQSAVDKLKKKVYPAELLEYEKSSQ